MGLDSTAPKCSGALLKPPDRLAVNMASMMSRKLIRGIVVGSALGAGIGVAGVIGAGTAGAAPGISYDGGDGDPIGFGDNSPTGAQANASKGNKALAISIFRPATATAVGQNRSGNRMFALDGTAGFVNNQTEPYTNDHDNRVMAINGTAMAFGEWTNVVAVGSTVSNKLLVTNTDGTKVYQGSQALATFPVPIRSAAIGVCGQRVAGNTDIFDVSGNITCVS